jgi:hypothetical protein
VCVGLVALLDRPLPTCVKATLTNTTRQRVSYSISPRTAQIFFPQSPPTKKSNKNRQNSPPPSRRPHTLRYLLHPPLSFALLSNCIPTLLYYKLWHDYPCLLISHTLPLTHADIKTTTTAISMTMTSPGQRISSPDFVDVEIPHAAGTVPSQQSRSPMSTAHLE